MGRAAHSRGWRRLRGRQKWDNSKSSFSLPSEVFDLCLDRGPLLVYLYLVYHKHLHRSADDLSCAVIGKAVGMCGKTVQKHLRTLENQRIIRLGIGKGCLSCELCPIWAQVPKRYDAEQLAMRRGGQRWITGEVFDAVFPLPNAVFQLGLKAGDLLVYLYLQYQKGARSGQCYPSYATIGAAVGMSRKTVQKHIQSLVDKGLVQVENTTVRWKDGRTYNGNLLYTLKPVGQSAEGEGAGSAGATEAGRGPTQMGREAQAQGGPSKVVAGKNYYA